MKVFIPKNGKPEIKIHSYDTWNADKTLGLIILPVLKKIQKLEQGYPFVEDEDVPENLRSEEVDKYGVGIFQKEKWDYVLSEMIFAFESLKKNWKTKFYSGKQNMRFIPIPETDFGEIKPGPKDTFKIDSVGIKEYQLRISKGFMLFGKYYESLWT